MTKKLREEGFAVGRFRVRTVMNRLGLKVTQRVAYKVTTKRKHSDAVADNLLNQNFNPARHGGYVRQRAISINDMEAVLKLAGIP